LKKPRYVYQSAQHSILRPHYQRWVWGPLLGRIPSSLSPNALTGISTLCCAASFLLATTASSSPAAMGAASFCVFAYLSLDNMDGAHARNTGQSSRLGEFLDHWLDTLNNGFVILGACLAVGLSPFYTLLVLSAGTLAFFAVQLELRYTGVFRMGRVADVEGNTAVSGLYLLVAALGPDFFAQPVAAGWPSLAVLLGVGVMGQALWTLASALFRLDIGRADCLPLCLCLAALIAWAALSPSASAGGTDYALLVAGFFANPVFTSGPILARLRGQSTRTADRLAATVVVAASGAAAAGFAAAPGLAWGVALLLAAMTLRYAHITVAALRLEPMVADVSPCPDGDPSP
jgi:phosphatidylglycerophosphate synthase